MTTGRHELILSPQSLRPGVSFVERAAAAAAAGFRGISLRTQDIEAAVSDGLVDQEQLAILRDFNLQVAEIGFATDWMSRDAAEREEAQSSLWKASDLFGPSYVNAGLWATPNSDEAVEAFRRFCDEASEHGLRVALEFVPYSGIPSLSAAWKIVAASGCSNCGLILDLWHAHRTNISPEDVAAIPANRWVSLQLADASPKAWPDAKEESRHRRLLPGHGCIDIRGYLRALATSGAKPAIAVEVINDELHALDSRESCIRLATASAAVLDAASYQARVPSKHHTPGVQRH